MDLRYFIIAKVKRILKHIGKRVDFEDSEVRQLLPGLPYTVPPKPARPDFLSVSAASIVAMEAYGKTIYKKLAVLAVAAGVASKETPEEEAALNFIQAVKDMKARFWIGDTIPEIQEEDIPKLSHYADKEANPLYPVPVLMDAQELEKFYYMLMPAKENTVQ